MLRAAISGRLSRTAVHGSLTSSAIVPVEKFRSTGQRLRVSCVIRANVAGLVVGVPSSLRAWRWTTAAPASYARRASSAISTGVYGMYGHWPRFASTPESAHVTTQRSG